MYCRYYSLGYCLSSFKEYFANTSARSGFKLRLRPWFLFLSTERADQTGALSLLSHYLYPCNDIAMNEREHSSIVVSHICCDTERRMRLCNVYKLGGRPNVR